MPCVPQRLTQQRPRRLELHERAERVEQDGLVTEAAWFRQGQPGSLPARRGSACGATASTRTGIPFRCAMPASRSRPAGSDGASWFTFTPPASFASRHPPRCPQPCGSATVPGVISSVTSTGTSTEPDSDVTRATSPSSRPAAPRRRDESAAHACDPPRISRGELCIQELCERSSRRPIRLSGIVAPQRRSTDASRSISPSAAASATCTRRSEWRTRSANTPVAI